MKEVKPKFIHLKNGIKIPILQFQKAGYEKILGLLIKLPAKK